MDMLEPTPPNPPLLHMLKGDRELYHPHIFQGQWLSYLYQNLDVFYARVSLALLKPTNDMPIFFGCIFKGLMGWMIKEKYIPYNRPCKWSSWKPFRHPKNNLVITTKVKTQHISNITKGYRYPSLHILPCFLFFLYALRRLNFLSERAYPL